VLLRQHDADKAGIQTVPTNEGITVELPNGQRVRGAAEAVVKIHPGIEVNAHIFDDSVLQHSLGSISALTNAPNGCEVMFSATGVTVTKNGETIMHTTKKPADKLWNLDLPISASQNKPATAQSNLVIRCDRNADFVKFMHAAFGSPAVSTFTTAAAMGFLGNLPRLTAKMIRENQPNTGATHKGHLDLTRQGQRSTKSDPREPPSVAIKTADEDESESPFSEDVEAVNDDIRNVYTKLVAASDVNSRREWKIPSHVEARPLQHTVFGVEWVCTF